MCGRPPRCHDLQPSSVQRGTCVAAAGYNCAVLYYIIFVVNAVSMRDVLNDKNVPSFYLTQNLKRESKNEITRRKRFIEKIGPAINHIKEI